MLLGGGNSNSSWSPTWSPTLVAAGSTAAQKHEDEGDASVFEPKRSLQETVAHDVLVVQSVTAGQAQTQLYLKNLRPGHSLFTVIYLACAHCMGRGETPTFHW